MTTRVLLSTAIVSALVLAACATGTVAPAGPKASVATGANVSAQLTAPGLAKPATVTFGSVQTAGDVSITASSKSPSVPQGFSINGKFFEITSTAKFDKATVCFEDASVTSKTKLLHGTGSTWNDRTSSVNPPKICGDFTSFSPVFMGDVACGPTTVTTALTDDVVAFLKASGCTVTVASASPSPTPAATTAAPSPTAATATPTSATPLSHGRALRPEEGFELLEPELGEFPVSVHEAREDVRRLG